MFKFFMMATFIVLMFALMACSTTSPMVGTATQVGSQCDAFGTVYCNNSTGLSRHERNFNTGN